MTKKQQQNLQSNKTHKTLRERLRKKRQQIKKHKKQKSTKHKQYNRTQQKQKYFHKLSPTFQPTSTTQHPLNYSKLTKHLQKFIDTYQDQIQHFYQLFTSLDQNGTVDISGATNPTIQKLLKKLFKYLPLQKNKYEYRKKQLTTLKLETLIKQLLTQSMEKYIQNGTDSEIQYSSSNNQDNPLLHKLNKPHRIKTKKIKIQQTNEPPLSKQQQKQIKYHLEHQQINTYQNLKLYPQNIQSENKITNTNPCIGPSITYEQRQQLAKIFDQEKKKNRINHEEDRYQQTNRSSSSNQEFQKIFSMAYNSNRYSKLANSQKQKLNEIPEELLAEGSGRIGQNQQIILQPQQFQQQQPRKLIDIHQQLHHIGKHAPDKSTNSSRRPFNRDRDIVYGRQRQFVNNGIFFDFKSRMTKPKNSSNYL